MALVGRREKMNCREQVVKLDAVCHLNRKKKQLWQELVKGQECLTAMASDGQGSCRGHGGSKNSFMIKSPLANLTH